MAATAESPRAVEKIFGAKVLLPSAVLPVRQSYEIINAGNAGE